LDIKTIYIVIISTQTFIVVSTTQERQTIKILFQALEMLMEIDLIILDFLNLETQIKFMVNLKR